MPSITLEDVQERCNALSVDEAVVKEAWSAATSSEDDPTTASWDNLLSHLAAASSQVIINR